MPWNFPFWQVFRAAVPAILAGNSVILKHAPNVGGCALAIEKLFHSCGLPVGSFTNLFLDNEEVARLIAHPHIRGVTLTGSVRAGSSVASIAGRHIKKTVLELGGSDPSIVYSDCDFNRALNEILTSRMLNSGQTCIATKRVLIQKKIYEKFKEALVEKVRALKTGNPLAEGIDLGPMARLDLKETLANQLGRALSSGANVVYQGDKADDCFFSPAVIENLAFDKPVYREEFFGPVINLVSFEETRDAIEIANDSDFGLGASVYTNDDEIAELCSSKIEAGSVFINGMVRSDPALPFGGIKNSGYGRELFLLGAREFVNIKTVARIN